jgi:hypothetical protein
VSCAVTDCSLEKSILAFLTADLLAIRPGLTDEPLASDGADASVRPATWEVVLVEATGTRGIAFSSVAVATSGVGLVT